MHKQFFRRWLVLTVVLVMVFALALPASANTYTSSNGLPAGVKVETSASAHFSLTGLEQDDTDSGSASGGTVTVKVAGSKGTMGVGKKKITATIKIYNDSDKAATLTFNWSQSKVHSLTLEGETVTAGSGTYTTPSALGPKEYVTMVIVTDFNGTTNQLTLSNFVRTEAKETANVAMSYDSAKGSVTADDATVTSGSTIADINPAVGTVLKATPASGCTFLGWATIGDNNEYNALVSTANPYTLKAVDDMNVQAIFVNSGSPVYYQVGADRVFDDLTEACTYATANNSELIRALNSGTIPAGTYTIPAGTTLHIPYNASNDICTTRPGRYLKDENFALGTITGDSVTYATPTAYRTLTMENGAHLVINGSLSLSGGQSSAMGTNGMPHGPVAFIDMAAGSSITINNGANLYAWGFITGSGSVIVENGGTVYEHFQFGDWRGGSQASSMAGNNEKVFPITQYFVQNVEVPMTLKAGSKEYGVTSVVVDVKLTTTFYDCQVPFVGTGAMFVPGSGGYIVKDYIEGEDRLKVDIYGDLNMQNLSVNVYVEVNSKDYVLPLTNNLTVGVHSGTTTISQDMAFLPGTIVQIDSGATVKLASGTNLFVYDTAEWNGKGFVYSKADFKTVKYANKSSTVTRDALADSQIIVNGTLDASQGRLFTTSGGANITSTDSGKVIVNPANETSQQKPTKTYQFIQVAMTEGGATGYQQIPITQAKLLNSDGNYLMTGNGKATTYTYTDGSWRCGEHTWNEGIVVTPATCRNAGVKNCTCTICGYAGEVTIEKTAHSYTNYASNNDATCLSNGTETASCDYACGATDTRNASSGALGHNLQQTATAKAPTCTEAGSEVKMGCTRCEYTEGGAEIPATGHTAGADATCTTAQTCTVCGATLTAALGHNYESVVTAPTCTAAGYTTYTCACGDTYTDDEVGATGHNYTSKETTAATCTAAGERTYTCSACGDSYTEDIKATGHNYSADWTKTEDGHHYHACLNGCDQKDSYGLHEDVDPKDHECDTCGHEMSQCADGEDVDHKCDHCGEDGISEHVYNTPKYNEDKHWMECACGAKSEEADHTYEKEVTPPSFTAGGYTTYTCSCGYSYKADETAQLTAVAQIVDGEKYQTLAEAVKNAESGDTIVLLADAQGATGFEPMDLKGATLKLNGWTLTGSVAGTVQMNGGTLKTYADNNETVITMAGPENSGAMYITSNAVFVLGTDWSMTVESGEASLGQNWQTMPGQKVVIASDANVTIPADKTFTIRGTVIVEEGAELTCEGTIVLGYKNATLTVAKDLNVTVAADLGDCALYDENTNTYSIHSHTAGAAADCENAQTCTECGAELEAAKGHTLTAVEAKAPTCTEAGYEAYEYCSACDYTTYEEVAATGHNYDAVVTAPTCTEAGYTTYTCACGDSYTGDNVDALGHNYTAAETTAPTCTEAGVTTYTCACGDSYTETIAAKGHTLTTVEAKAPTCTEAGYEAYEYCSACDYTTYEEVAATGHNYDAVVTAPTCTAEGYTTYTCACGDSYVADKVAALGHTAGAVEVENASEANCRFEGGYDNVIYCTVCGEEVSRETVTVPKTEHDFKVVKFFWSDADGNYTCEAEGKCQTYGCAETTTVSASEITTKVTDATCTQAGETACTATFAEAWVETQTKTYPLEAKGHSAAEAVVENKVDATCSATGSYDSVVYCSVCDAEMSRETKALDLAAHTEGTVVVENEVAATCTAEGSYDNVVYCTVCNAELSRNTITTDKAAHTPAEAEEENRTESTCTVAGSYERVVYCSVCKTHEISRTKVDLALAAHTLEKVVAQTETCNEDGNIEHWKCTAENCGKLFLDGNGVEVTTEEYVKIPAAHKDEAPKDHVCDVCKETLGECEDKDGDKLCDICEESMVKGVAQIGETIYENLEDALYAAKNLENPTITLLANIEGEVTISQAVTIVKGEFAFAYKIDGCYKDEPSNDGKTVAFVLSHTPGEAVEENRKESTTLVKGSYDSVVYCSVCDAEMRRNIVELALAANPYLGTNMTLKDSLSLNIAISVKNMNSNFTATITRNYCDGVTAPVTYDVADEDWVWHNQAKGQVKISYHGLAAKEMCDEITLTIYNEKGDVYAVVTDSIRAYGQRMVDKYTAQGKNYNPVQAAMYVDMLNYGTAAQLRFGYCDTNPAMWANASVTAEQQKFATADIATEDIVNVQSADIQANLTLKSTITMKIAVLQSKNTAAAYAVVSYTSHGGKNYTQRIERTNFTKNGTFWVFEAPGLAIADGQTVVSVTIFDSEDNPISVNTDSMESYAGRKIGTTSADAELLDKLLRFTRSTYAAFHS